MATESLQRIKSLKNLEKTLQDSLNKSRTALSTGTTPTGSDVNTQLKLMKTQKERESLEQERLRSRLYPESATGAEKTLERDEGPISRGLAALSTPLYGVVGAVEAALGKGTKKGLSNIPANIKERGLFGDLLKREGAPGIVAMPIGLALDIALDPVNWATLGTGALIPRVGAGLFRGGVTGASKGISSGLLTKAENIGRMIPGVAKKAVRAAETGQEARGLSAIFKNIVSKAGEARKEYRAVTGMETLEQELERKAAREFTSDKLRKKLGGGVLGKIYESVRPRTRNWWEERKLSLKKNIPSEAAVPGTSTKQVETLTSMLRSAEEAESGTAGILKEMDIASGRGMEAFDQGAEVALSGKDIVRAVDSTGLPNSNVIAERMLSEAETEQAAQKLLRAIYDASDESFKKMNKTEIDWYDRMVERVNKNPVAEKIFKGYSDFINVFKSAKVGGSPSAYMNAVVGNLTMPFMAGVKMYRPDRISDVKTAFNILRGKRGLKESELIDRMVQDLGWQRFMEDYSPLVRATYGFNPVVFKREGQELAEIMKAAAQRSNSIIGGKDWEEVNRVIRNTREQVLANMRRKKEYEFTTTQIARKTQSAIPETGDIAGEIFTPSYNAFLDKLKAIDNPMAKAVYWSLTQPMEWYGYIDQSYKFGTALNFSLRGIDEDELRLLSRIIKISPTDYTKSVDGLYKLNAEKASEVVQEIYMNYAAMPAAVKMLRSIPFFGAPFASFMYSMGVKTGKTLRYNPAAFNKIQSLLGEAGGEKSPIEKTVLNQPYYQWFNRPGMQKLPFFEENPVYLNIANMVPYYTMNIFQPVERRYPNRTSGIVSSLVDRMPFLKTPEGQVMFDYFIQPVVLREAVPKGMFDQPLWPVDASALEKSRNVIRSLMESVMPGFTGFAGLVTPESVADYLPSFQWRRLARAKAGKTAEGLQTKEPAVQKTVRGLGSMVGLPTQVLELENISKKQLKK